MNEYHKIPTVFARDPATNYKTLLLGQYAEPELEYLAHNQWVFTEKVDGTSIRVMFNGEAILFGGRTDNAQIPSFLVTKLNERFLPQLGLFKKLFPDGVCLYGEGYGARIHKGGGNYRADQDFILFDVKVRDWWLKRDDVIDVAQKMDIEIVPILGKGTLPQMVEMAQVGFLSTWGNFIAEGIVARPEVELKARNGKRIITKIKHKDF